MRKSSQIATFPKVAKENNADIRKFFTSLISGKLVVGGQGKMVVTSVALSDVEIMFPTKTTAVLTYQVKQTNATRDGGKSATQKYVRRIYLDSYRKTLAVHFAYRIVDGSKPSKTVNIVGAGSAAALKRCEAPDLTSATP